MTAGVDDRRRAWTVFGVVAFVIAIYLALWVAYAANGLVDYGRYEQLPAGATGDRNGIRYRAVSMTLTSVLVSDGYGDPASAAPGSTWLVAVIEATKLDPAEDMVCAVSLLGPDRRLWEPDAGSAPSRRLDGYCDDKVPVGTPQQYESIFVVPDRYVGQLYGLVLRNVASSAPSQVLRPAL